MNRLRIPTIALMAALAPSTLAANLTWVGNDGGNPTFWDQLTANWAGDFTTYLDGDDVTFDDSASTFTVDMQAGLSPASVSFGSAAGSVYTLIGAGSVINQAPLSLTGSVSVLLNNNATNDFGAVSIAAGATLTHDLTAGQTQFFGALSGAGAIAIDGQQLVLTGDGSAFTGTITVNDGGLLNFNNAVPTAGPVVINAGGSLGSFNDGYVNATPVTLSGGLMQIGNGQAGLAFNGGVTLTAASSITLFDGQATIASVAAGTHALNLSSGGQLDLGSLSGTGEVTVAGAGTVALTGAYNAARNVTINGGVLDVTAAGGTHTVTNGNTLTGNGGALTGNVAVQSGGTLVIGGAEPLTGQPNINTSVTYVDADVSGNTTLADGTALSDGSVGYSTTNAVDGLWGLRTFANAGTILESSGNPGGEDTPMLRTRISGLTPGEEFTVFTYFWGATGGTWRGRAVVSDTPPVPEIQGYDTIHADGSDFLPMDGSLDAEGLNGDLQTPIGVTRTGDSSGDIDAGNANWVSADTFDSPVLMGEGNRFLSQVTLGTFTVDASGNIDVYIDDLANADQGNRTWYDGVGYGTQTVLPGFLTDIRAFTVDGDLTLNTGSTVQLDLFATNVLEKLDVTGTLFADGTLDVAFAAGAPTPQAGDSFDILDFASASGGFDVLNLPSLGGGLDWNTTNLLTTGVISVTGGVVGDTDGDGDIDDFDLLNAISNFTGSLAPGTGGKGVPEGDTDADADVDDFDLLNMISGFTGSLSAPEVPEPGSVALLAFGGLALLRRRR